jgi:hypothetical protein
MSHRARIALLANGPREGERRDITPGQMALAISERFDNDQGHADVIDHYAYEGRTINDPDTVVFTFREQERHVIDR